jgi:hypothetical protein
MWYRYIKLAEQGELNPKGPNGEDLEGMLRDFIVKSQTMQQNDAFICPHCKNTVGSLNEGKFCENDGVAFEKNLNALKGKKVIDLNKLKTFIKNSVLDNYIKDVTYEFDNNFGGTFNPATKTLKINLNPEIARRFFNTTNIFAHELVHSASPIKAKSNQYWLEYEEKSAQLRKMLELEKENLLELTDEQRSNIYKQMEANYIEFEKKTKSLRNSGPKGRTKYFSNEEIMAQSKNLNKAFNKNILNRVYSQYYKKDRLLFIKDFKQFMNDLSKIITLSNDVDKTFDYAKKSNDPNFMAHLNALKNSGIDEDDFKLLTYRDSLEKNFSSMPFLQKVEAVSGENVSYILSQINDQNFYRNFTKKLFNQLLGVQKIIDPENNLKLRDNPNPIKFSSDQIVQETSKIVGNQVSTPKSKNALSSALPIISKLFKQLGEYLQKNLNKLNNSKAGKVFNFAMLVKDVYFIITTADKISKQLNAGEEVMVKDQYDLGLTIVSILTDQQTQAILRAIFPPIIVLLNNPQIQAWLVGINIGANVLSGAVSVADQLGTMAGTTNKSEGATSGIMNTPGSAQALVMPVFQLREKYGEVYNALIDVEKGLSVSQAIAKHIMKDASGGFEPYRLSLFYKFTENKNKIIQYQNSPAFNKLPEANRVLYPSGNSTYAISSYKKARDSQELAKQQSRQQSYNRNFGVGGVSSIPVQ